MAMCGLLKSTQQDGKKYDTKFNTTHKKETKGMSKILIAIPTFENIMPETFKSIYDLDPCGNEL